MYRFLDFELKKEGKLWPLIFNQTFRGIAVSLLSLFSSIYIYQTIFKLTLQSKIAFLSVYLYYLGVYLLKFLANLFAEELSLRLGLKRQIYLGLFFFAVCLTLLYFSSSFYWLIFMAAPFWGLATGFYWFGSHGMMAKVGRDGHFGKESGLINLMVTLPLIIVPFLGGSLISFFGYHALFGAALCFLLLSLVSLKSMAEVKTRHDTDVWEVWGLFKTHPRVFWAYFGDTMAAVIYAVVFPLYLFLILKKEIALGGFFSLSMLAVALFNLFIGRWSDIRGERGLILYGAVVQAFAWLGRIFAKGVGVLFALDITDRVTDSMIAIPMQAVTYKKAREGRATGRAVLFRELSITLGGVITCLLLVFWAFLGIELKWVFLLAFFASFLPVLLINHQREEKKK